MKRMKRIQMLYVALFISNALAADELFTSWDPDVVRHANELAKSNATDELVLKEIVLGLYQYGYLSTNDNYRPHPRMGTNVVRGVPLTPPRIISLPKPSMMHSSGKGIDLIQLSEYQKQEELVWREFQDFILHRHHSTNSNMPNNPLLPIAAPGAAQAER